MRELFLVDRVQTVQHRECLDTLQSDEWRRRCETDPDPDAGASDEHGCDDYDDEEAAHEKEGREKKAVKRRVAGGLDAEIRALAKSSKIQAIKVYRERTGVGLREAKEAVEAIMKG